VETEPNTTRITPELYQLYLSCLAIETRQLEQMLAELQEHAKARLQCQEALEELRQGLQIQPLPGLDSEQLQNLNLPQGLDPVLQALEHTLKQQSVTAWIENSYHQLQHLLPRLWDPGEHQIHRLQTLRARIELHAELYGNPRLQSTIRQLVKQPITAQLHQLITDIQAELPEMADLRQHDPLTGLPGLAHLVDAFGLIQLMARHHHSPFSLAIIELTGFEQQQAERGHYLARLWIRSFTHQLTAAMPASAQMALWAPYRLLLLLPNLSLAETVLHLEAFRRKLSAQSAWESFNAGVTLVAPGQSFEAALLVAWEQLCKSDSGPAIRCDRQALVNASQRHILVVDDDPLVAEMLAYLLTHEGHRVSALADGTSVLDLLARESVALIILDIRMPGMTGFEVLEQIRSHGCYDELPIVMLTSIKDEKEIARGFELGANDFLYKPFSPNELLVRLQRFLR
jgi:PleD family two-component response regulator